MITDPLTVFRDQSEVGKLWLDREEQFTFQYSRDWLHRPDAIPLSLSHPLQDEPIDQDRTKAFFVNLLPEKNRRRSVAQHLNISEADDFRLLGALAGDCAGDVSMYPRDQIPATTPTYRALSENELDERVERLQERPWLVDEDGVRSSVAGNQQKLPVFIDQDCVYIPVAGAPSSHIIKPQSKCYENLVENEAFCSELANQLGIQSLSGRVHLGHSLQYWIERGDRVRRPDGHLVRVHQEDFCQVLNISPENKYEMHGGPSLTQCFDLVRRYSVAPAADVKALVQWVMFNYFIGNHDIHAKTLSFRVDSAGPRLAPFCDLICTIIYQPATEPMAMQIGGEGRPSWVVGKRWENFSRDIQIKQKYVKSLLGSLARQVMVCAEKLAKEYMRSNLGESAIPRILQVIKTRARNSLNNLRAIS